MMMPEASCEPVGGVCKEEHVAFAVQADAKPLAFKGTLHLFPN